MKEDKFSYEEAIHSLFGLQKYGVKFGLSKTSNLLRAFGDPHQGQAYIHIGGTNGKGSVGAMLESVLAASGLKVGFYSSPHLASFTERLRVNGEKILREKVATLTAELMNVVDSAYPPTFFEITTAMALLYFAREKTDIAVMEVGMGGRLDATNVITPLVSVITNISLEHQAFLGRRLADIAGEKAGIIKPGVDLVTGATQPPVLKVIGGTCEAKKAPFWRVGKNFRYRSRESGFDYYGLSRRFTKVELGLRGRFQYRNAALALGTLELLERKGYRFSSEEIRMGLRENRWPGRLHVISERPLIVLDGAHNPEASRKLAESVRAEFRYKRLIVVLGVMADKDIRGIVEGIVPHADVVIFTRPAYYRSAMPENIRKETADILKQGEILSSIPQALDRARKIADAEDMILVCGSLFTVGEALTYFDPVGFPAEGVI